MLSGLNRTWIGVAAGLMVGVTVLVAPVIAQDGVTIRLFRFAPTSIEVPAGTKIVFRNEDDITHTVTSGSPEHRNGAFDHQLVGQGATAIVELSQPGVYPYFCDRHRSMRGEIRVK